jgi:hypothetical protein
MGTHELQCSDRVCEWRRQRLLAAGFGPPLAGQLAAMDEIDLHELLELVDRGCPPVIAARIVAPLGTE